MHHPSRNAAGSRSWPGVLGTCLGEHSDTGFDHRGWQHLVSFTLPLQHQPVASSLSGATAELGWRGSHDRSGRLASYLPSCRPRHRGHARLTPVGKRLTKAGTGLLHSGPAYRYLKCLKHIRTSGGKLNTRSDQRPTHWSGSCARKISSEWREHHRNCTRGEPNIDTGGEFID
jgi:hypothetical protein